MLSASGGLANEANSFYKRLASLLASKWDQPYSTTLCWLRCRLAFSLLHSAIQSIRGARSSRGHAINAAVQWIKIVLHKTAKSCKISGIFLHIQNSGLGSMPAVLHLPQVLFTTTSAARQGSLWSTLSTLNQTDHFVSIFCFAYYWCFYNGRAYFRGWAYFRETTVLIERGEVL